MNNNWTTNVQVNGLSANLMLRFFAARNSRGVSYFLVNFKITNTNCKLTMRKRVPLVDNSEHENELELLFTGIFKTYEYRLYALALKLTKSDLYAKDIIQEVFLKLWEHRSSIHSIENIEAWLCRLTENKVIDFLRKAAADGRLKETLWNKLPNPEIEHTVEVKEYDHIIQKAIDQLPPQRKLIYYLNREEGLNYQQIANELHISRHTFKNQLSNALQSIRRFLTQGTRFLGLFF
jgi:RNA polymerase sigma-70 factor (ECF subfamily)